MPTTSVTAFKQQLTIMAASRELIACIFESFTELLGWLRCTVRTSSQIWNSVTCPLPFLYRL